MIFYFFLFDFFLILHKRALAHLASYIDEIYVVRGYEGVRVRRQQPAISSLLQPWIHRPQQLALIQRALVRPAGLVCAKYSAQAERDGSAIRCEVARGHETRKRPHTPADRTRLLAPPAIGTRRLQASGTTCAPAATDS